MATLHIEPFYLGCLAHASYLIADREAGVAAVVDPQRDVDQYLESAARLGVRIRHVFLTHFHADFLAGHLELRDRAAAEICLGARAEAEYKFRAFADGEILALGTGRLQVLHTPGHTPESITLLVFDAGATEPRAALTGDTLFLGDVGRPDLRASLGWSAADLGNLLYDSLHTKLLPLPDATLIYPAHGAGSLCGKQLSRDSVGLMGDQRRLNYALQPMSREAFLQLVLADQPDAPAYFTYDAVLNTRERPSLETSLQEGLRPLSPEQTARAVAGGAIVLDTRDAVEHARAHWRGAVNIPLDGAFATWCGTVLPASADIVIVAHPGREREAAVRLGRIGFDRVAGFLAGGMAALQGEPDSAPGARLAGRARPVPRELQAELAAARPPRLLDVRTAIEHARGTIPGSLHIPLQQLCERRAELAGHEPYVVYCQTGYRSSIAASLLEGWAIEARDLEGGFQAWQAALA